MTLLLLSRRSLVRRLGALALAATVVAPFPLHAQPAAPKWTASWGVAPRDYNEASPIPGAPGPQPLTLRAQTVRVRLDPTVGGERVRVRFSNVVGKTPLHLGAASVGYSTGDDAVSPRSLRVLTFAGRRDAVVAPGAELWSDAAALAVEPGQVIAVSLYLPDATRAATAYQPPMAPAWVAQGDVTRKAKLSNPAASVWGHVVTGLDVERAQAARVVVAFGDSITYGIGATANAEASYPSVLAKRLRSLPAVKGSPATAIGVINMGIGGNRLLADGVGPKALDRFERDVLSQSGVTHTIILIGVNDIGFGALAGVAGSAVPASDSAPVERLTAGLQSLVQRARARGVKVLLGTVPPFKGSGYASDAAEIKRQALNRWIRGRQDVDGVVDFDAVLRDPDDAQALAPAYDSGDHLHPGSAGYAAMAAAVDVRELLE